MIEAENMEIAEKLPDEDNAELLVHEEEICRKKGKAEDIPAFQGIICLLLALALILLNLRLPQMAEEFYLLIKSYSSSEQELFENPIYAITEFAEGLCRK